MSPAEFKRKWHRYQGKESAAYVWRLQPSLVVFDEVPDGQLKDFFNPNPLSTSPPPLTI
jgi:hypothetical protein